MRKTVTRSIAATLAAITIATSFPLAQASAATVGKSAATVSSDFSARRHYAGAGAAAAFGAFALIAGAAIAASQRSDNCGPYGCGYAYAPGPYYGGYGPGYYPHRHYWHRW